MNDAELTLEGQWNTGTVDPTYMHAHTPVMNTETRQIIGHHREIHGTYWPDGLSRWACYDRYKRFLGLTKSHEGALRKIGRIDKQLSEWPAVPFANKDEKASL
jgi:hypothetical protein